MKSLWFALFILCTIMLTIVAVYPDSNKVILEGESGFRWDYLQHFAAYFIFAGLYIFWRSDSSFSIKGIEMAVLFAITFIFSILTEYIQVLIPGRTFNIIDMFYNLGGVLTGILINYFLIIRIYLRKKYARH